MRCETPDATPQTLCRSPRSTPAIAVGLFSIVHIQAPPHCSLFRIMSTDLRLRIVDWYRLFLLTGALVLTPLRATAEEVKIPPPQGLVSDFAGVIDQTTHGQLTRLLQELKDKTGAEIAIVTVETTQPLTALDYT